MPSRASLSKVWGSLGSSGRGLTWVLVVVVVVAVVLLVWWGCSRYSHRTKIEPFTSSDARCATVSFGDLIVNLNHQPPQDKQLSTTFSPNSSNIMPNNQNTAHNSTNIDDALTCIRMAGVRCRLHNCGKGMVGYPCASSSENTPPKTKLPNGTYYYDNDPMNGQWYNMVPIQLNSSGTVLVNKNVHTEELNRFLSPTASEPYVTGTLLFKCTGTSFLSENNDVTPSGYCAQHKTAEECNSPCIWTSNPTDITGPHCSCDCSKITDSTICTACNSCHYDGTRCKSTKTTSFYQPPQPPSAQTTVTLGGPFSPNPLNQGLSESPSTSLTTFTPSTSLTPTYPSYSPPSQQPQQMTTPAAARDYYNYGYSNGYSNGYYASLYSRYPYYGYSNGYNNGYSNNNSYYGYYGGYAQGSGTPVASQESL